MPLAEQDERKGRGRGDQPTAAPVPPSTSKSEAAAPAPAPSARAVPGAAPSVAERSAVPSLDQAASGAAGKDLAKTIEPADAEAERKSLKAATRARESKTSVDKAKLPGAPVSREATGSPRSPEPLSSARGPGLPDAQQALAEIKSFVQSAGGSIEAVKPDRATRQPQSLTIRIPAQSLPAFLDLLGRIGQLRGAAETRAHTSGTEPILVQISFEQVP